jgi:hypothetical protein
MKYRELIQFEPITEVVRFGDLKKESNCEKFVRTFVFSDRYRNSYIPLICEDLNFSETQHLVNGRYEDKEFFGLQIVGSYGTGKSHLMTLFSLIAENEKYLQYVSDDKAKQDLSKIAGKYKVLRFEINTTAELWDVVCYQIDKFLRSIGVDYSISEDRSPENNDTKLMKMMAAFEEKYPDKGFLLVIDEMLAYLKGRSGSDKLNRDLQVLQALAQISNQSKFRIAFGVQEMIYSAPEFQFAKEMLLHVNDRYRELTITKEDVKFIAQKRMLNKSDEQRQLIRDHLSKFTKYFADMHAHLEDYVSLFPVHPSYFENFEQIRAGKSQREILKTLSNKFAEIIDSEVPDDQPGLISYDTYWDYIDGNATLKTDPDVSRVSEIMHIINGKIDDNFTGARRRNAPIAHRVANACAVKILQQDLTKTNGATAETLTNDLCYVNPLFDSFDELVEYIESVAHNIQSYTAGQYFYKNKDNGEYHLCVEGGVNYEELINIYAHNTLTDGQKDEYFFHFLLQALPIENEVYRSSFKIWAYSIPWKSRNVMRDGYIFMGYDNERPTTQPQQHFYIYFPPIFDKTGRHFADKEDEVYFIMDDLSDDIREYISLYGAAIALGNNADSASKSFYQTYQKKYYDRLRDIFDSEFYSKTKVQYCGQVKPLSAYPVQQADSKEEAVSRVASEIFEDHFDTENPDYPSFTLFPEPTTSTNLDRRINAAKKKIVRPHDPNREGEYLLTGLGLWNNGLTHETSPYANSLLNMLRQKPEGQVVNRDEIIHQFWRSSDLYLSNDFNIEDSYEFIVIATLVALGEIELVLSNGHILTAANISEIESMTRQNHDYINFRCIRQPHGYNYALFKVLFMALVGRDLSQQLDNPSTIPTLIEAAKKVAGRAARMETKIFGGISQFGIQIIDSAQGMELRNKMTVLKGLCDKLGNFNTKAKLKNLPEEWTSDAIKQRLDSIKDLDRLEKLFLRLEDYRERINYIDQAMNYAEPELAQKMRLMKNKLPDVLMSTDPSKGVAFLRDVDEVKDQYAHWYLDEYKRCHINEEQKQRKDRILASNAATISHIVCDAPFVQSTRYDEWKQDMDRLQPADPSVTLDAIKRVPYRGFNPLEVTGSLPDLNQLDENIKDIYDGYVHDFHNTLDDPAIKETIKMLEPEDKSIVERFQEGTLQLDSMYAPKLKGILSTLFSGITPVEITKSDLTHLFSRAMTPEEAKAAFCQLVDSSSRGKNHPRIIMTF